MVSDAATPRMLPCVVCVDSEGVFASPEVQLNQQDLEMDSDDEAQVGESWSEMGFLGVFKPMQRMAKNHGWSKLVVRSLMA